MKGSNNSTAELEVIDNVCVCETQAALGGDDGEMGCGNDLDQFKVRVVEVKEGFVGCSLGEIRNRLDRFLKDRVVANGSGLGRPF